MGVDSPNTIVLPMLSSTHSLPHTIAATLSVSRRGNCEVLTSTSTATSAIRSFRRTAPSDGTRTSRADQDPIAPLEIDILHRDRLPNLPSLQSQQSSV